MIVLLFLLLNGLVTYIVVRSTVKTLIVEERERLLRDLERAFPSIGRG